MANFLGSLQSLALYIGVIALGVFVGSRSWMRSRELKWMSGAQTILLVLLIGCLGVGIGANEEVISSLDTIGLSALVITIFALIGSVFGVFLIRKCLKLDRTGQSTEGVHHD